MAGPYASGPPRIVSAGRPAVIGCEKLVTSTRRWQFVGTKSKAKPVSFVAAGSAGLVAGAVAALDLSSGGGPMVFPSLMPLPGPHSTTLPLRKTFSFSRASFASSARNRLGK